jgi:hypothetical protein
MTVTEWAIGNPWTAAACVVGAITLAGIALSKRKKRKRGDWKLLREKGKERDWRTTVYNPKAHRDTDRKR